MAEIKPFKAIHYNTGKIKDMTDVVSPPYDVISEEKQLQLMGRSPYNFVHIDFNKDKPQDTGDNNKYTRAKKTFDEWIKKKVFVEDEKPGIYFYKQDYKVLGQKYSRLGFISLLELESEEDSKVHPHENTHAYAVDDRFQLTKALHSYLSPIFVCYSDKQKKVDKIFNKHVASTPPLFDVVDEDHVHHTMWRIDDPGLVEEINRSVAGQNLFIADGHHRYQMANEYRKIRLTRKTNVTGKEPFNYVMTYFTNLDSRGLQIFPMHRIIRKMPKDLDFLEEFFRIDKVSKREEMTILLAKAGRNEHAFGMYTKDGVRLLRLKNKLLIKDHVKEGSEEYKSLDATILKSFIFDRLGVESSDIIYTKDAQEAFDKVDNGEADAGFIMNPVRISQLKSIALQGERMPPKTTYFYPKVLSGLTVYKMD